ncbi:hypothetical protein L5515_010401 [Caenorhabditis briggsae]|uniref:CXXC-type zinc finger protein 1 n=1 Tax=Caenorhabditis briggsae TaxID=6238 RepID=A0AAE9EQT4_CAEBR|nr:hypothetical protein L5515_010401 [Caenorhabditis briggsae]
MSGTSTKESSEDNEAVWRHRCFKCIRCNERDDCKVCWPCKSGRTCDKRRCFSAKKLYEESLHRVSQENLKIIMEKSAAREAALASTSSGPLLLPTTSAPSGPSTSSSGAGRHQRPSTSSAVPSTSAAREPKKRGRKKKSELLALQEKKINEMDYVPHRPTRQQSADLRKKRNQITTVQSQPERAPRQCLNPDCIYESRADSKYCSDPCGLILAKMRLEEVLPIRVKEYYTPGPGGPKIIESELQARQKAVDRDLEQLNECEKNINAFLEKLQVFIEKQIPLQPLAPNDKFDDNLYETCVVCGLNDIPVRKYVKHIELCWSRNEKLMSFGTTDRTHERIYCEQLDVRAGTYCKRLKSLCPEHRKPGIEHSLKVCGYPKKWETGTGMYANSLSELIEAENPFGDEGCRTKRDLCHKHHKWVPSLSGSIELEQANLVVKVYELCQEQKNLRTQLDWSNNALSILMHKQPNFPNPELFRESVEEMRSAAARAAEDPEDPQSRSTSSSKTDDEFAETADFMAMLARQNRAAEEAQRAAEEDPEDVDDEEEEEEGGEEPMEQDDDVDVGGGPEGAARQGKQASSGGSTSSSTTSSRSSSTSSTTSSNSSSPIDVD